MPQEYTFRKKNTWTCRFQFWQCFQNVFCSNSVSFFSKFEKFSGISPIMVVILSFSEWSLYLELFFRAHRIHVSHPCCKKVARSKLGYNETGRFVGLFFQSLLSKSPTICRESEWKTWCPTKFFTFAVWQFFDQSCCGGRFKTELIFGVSKDFSDFHFLSFVTRVFNRL